MRQLAEAPTGETAKNMVVVFSGRNEPVETSTRPDLRSMRHEDALPVNLGPILREAVGLIVLDALAFPFEALGDVERGVPLAVRMPSGLDPGGLFDVLGEDLFAHLTTLDSVAVEPARWGPIADRYRLPDARRLPGDPSDDEAVVRAAIDRFKEDREELDRDRVEGAALAGGPPALPLFGRYPRLRAAKSRLKTDTDQMRRTLAELEQRQPESRPLHVIEIATVAGRLLPALPRGTVGFRAFETWGERSRTESVGGGMFQVEPLEQHLRLPVERESTDIVMIVADLATNPEHLLVRLTREALRATRSGGFIVFMTDLVPRNPAEREAMHGADRFVQLVISASGQRLVLDSVEAVRHPGDDLHRTGILIFQRIGAPSRW